VLNALTTPLRRAWSWFSKQPQWHAFVDWQTYYQAYLRTDSPHAWVQHHGPLVGDVARQIELINGMAGGRAASLVWAPPGCGKSRFALELARRMEKGRDRWQVLFVRHDDGAVREELHELTRLKHIVLIVDDAHECPDLVKLLAAACAAARSETPLHLVCLTRSTGRASVSHALQGVFPPGAVQEMDLGRPPAPVVRRLIDQLLPKSSPLHRETIARFARQSFFLAVLVCSLLGRDRKLPQSFQRQDLRDRACREPLKEAVAGLCSVEAATRALGVYAALAPVTKAGAEVRDLAAELSGMTPANLDVLLERVLAAGLFQESGRGSIRPIPDLIGDLILEEACLDSQGRPTPYSKQLLDRLFEMDPVATVGNCADIGQLFGADPDTDLVSGLVLSSGRAASLDNKWSVLKLLQACQPLAARRPETLLQLAGILETRGVLRRSPPALELFGIDCVEMQVLALLMRAAEVQADIVPVALQLGRDLYAAARGDDRSSEHVLAVLRENCRFESGRGIPHARAVVNALRTWVTESDTGAAVLASTLSAQFLALDVEVRQESDRSLDISRTPLNPSPEVWEVRDLAVDIIARAITRAEPTVQFVALATLESYADTQVALDNALAESWRPQLERELAKFVEAINKVPAGTNSLPVWATLERIGWHWWIQDSDALHRAGKAILSSIPATEGYQLWKALYSQQLPITTVVPEGELLLAPLRLDYFQGLSALREADSIDQARKLFDILDPRYADSDAWRALWRSVAEQVPSTPLHHQAGAVVGELARRHPEAAWSFVTEAQAEGPLFPVLTFLLDELGKQDRARRSEESRRVQPGTRLEEAWLRALGLPQELNEAERALLARALRSPEPKTIHHSARALLNSSETSPGEVFDAVFATIGRYPADETLWDLALTRFAHWGSIVLSPAHGRPSDSLTHVAKGLVTLMRTYGSHIRWGFQQHTRQLDGVLAILAVACPEPLQEWIQRLWGRPASSGSGWNDESPLNVTRLKSAMASIRDSAVAAQWTDAYLIWMKGPRPLGEIAARGLAELCTLGDPRVGQLATEVAAHPTEFALQSFAEFVAHQASKPEFATHSLALLEIWARYPPAYAKMEDVIIRALAHQSGGRIVGHPWPGHIRALDAIEARRHTSVASALFSASLVRAERQVSEAMKMTSALEDEPEEP
jgi:hypothetical protein